MRRRVASARLRLPASAVAVVLALGALAGCGASDEEKVQTVVRDFLAGLADRDGEKVCEQLTDEAARSLVRRADRSGKLSCPVALRRVVRRTSAPQRARLRSPTFSRTTVRDERATVQVQFKGSGRRTASQTFQLRKQDDDWKISARGSGRVARTRRQPSR